MKKQRKTCCAFCGEWFSPEPNNRFHQHCCPKEARDPHLTNAFSAVKRNLSSAVTVVINEFVGTAESKKANGNYLVKHEISNDRSDQCTKNKAKGFTLTMKYLDQKGAPQVTAEVNTIADLADKLEESTQSQPPTPVSATAPFPRLMTARISPKYRY